MGPNRLKADEEDNDEEAPQKKGVVVKDHECFVSLNNVWIV